ncbi:hypothetical protein OE88DRAFT_864650 [Heliocybe sulcata]|uniref:Secreted protein n=1 Tax=Heliocybe sulcata TaxID=5364 RepID=A0A5C3MNH0_9AGAM|nr:hypothetical protein OE88DRAFT_864650 [Heliocybe sulcata]
MIRGTICMHLISLVRSWMAGESSSVLRADSSNFSGSPGRGCPSINGPWKILSYFESIAAAKGGRSWAALPVRICGRFATLRGGPVDWLPGLLVESILMNAIEIRVRRVRFGLCKASGQACSKFRYRNWMPR